MIFTLIPIENLHKILTLPFSNQHQQRFHNIMIIHTVVGLEQLEDNKREPLKVKLILLPSDVQDDLNQQSSDLRDG